MALAEALVHPVEVGREQRGLVSAGAGADLDDGVAVVERIPREQQLVQLLGQRGDLGGQPGQVGLGQRGELGIGFAGQLPSLVQLVFGAGQGARPAERWARAGRVPGPATCSWRRILGRGGIGESRGRPPPPAQRLAESGLHGLRLGRRRGRLGLVLPAEAIHPAGGVHQPLLAGEVRVALGAHFDVDRAAVERVSN